MKSKLFYLCGVTMFGMLLSNTLGGLTANMPDAFPEVDPISIDDTHQKSSHNEQIEKQIRILKKFSIDGYTSSKNYGAITQLTNNGIALSHETISELDAGNYNGVVKVDLFEYDNLITAIRRALYWVLNADATEAYGQDTNNFFMSSGNIRQRIESVPGLLQVIASILAELNSNEEEGEELDKLLRILRLVKEAYDLACANPNLGENHPFTRFLRGVGRALRVVIVRLAMDEFMKKNRESIETSAQKTSKSMSASVNVKGNVNGVNLGASISGSKSEGGSDFGLYTISFGGGIKATVGAGFSKFSADLGVGADITRSAIFFSLEQLLDESIRKGKNIIPFEPKTVKKLLKNRKKLQQCEKNLMMIFNDDFVAFLRMLSIIPGSVSVEMLTITRSENVWHYTNIRGSIESSISFLNYVGFTVEGAASVNIQEMVRGWLTLVSDDFSPADGLSVKYITNFIGKKYDFSQKYGSRSDEVTLLQIVTYLRNYVEVLSTLASNPSDKEASKRKHKIEDLWLPGGRGITSEGREGVLKSMIVTLLNLRETTSQDRHIEIFKQGYAEALKLVKLFEFSKDKKDRKGTFKETTVADNKGFTATLYLPQGIGMALTYSDNKGNTFQENNGKYIQVDIKIPLNIGAIAGMKIIQNKFSKAFESWEQKKIQDEAQVELMMLLSDMLVIAGKSAIGNSVSMKIGGNSNFTIKFTYIGGNINQENENVQGLPRYESIFGENVRELSTYEPILREKGRWVVQYIKTTAMSNSSFGAGLFSANKNFSKWENIFGENTLTHISSRFNTFALGLTDKSPTTKELNSLWGALAHEQARPLGKLFLNITDPNSNVRYELQCIFNIIMRNIPSNEDREHCLNVFIAFMLACEAYKNQKNEKNFKKALNAFYEVLQMNHQWNFLPHLNNSFKSKTTHLKAQQQNELDMRR